MDLKQIKSLMKEFDESGLCKLKLKQDETVLEFEKPCVSYEEAATKPVTVQHPIAPAFPAPDEETGKDRKSVV